MSPRLRTSAIFVFTVAFLFATKPLYARAGGGAGGTVSWILLPFAIIYVLYKNHQIKKRKKESSWVIKQSGLEDPLWNGSKMEALAKNMFFQMQEAWMERDLATVKNSITVDLYNDYKTQLGFMKKNGTRNIMEAVSVTEVSIVSTEEYHDHIKDAFVAYIAGKMIDYTINESSGQIIQNPKKKLLFFSDTYHFIRNGDNWILNSISNKVSLSYLTNAVNYKEP